MTPLAKRIKSEASQESFFQRNECTKTNEEKGHHFVGKRQPGGMSYGSDEFPYLASLSTHHTGSLLGYRVAVLIDGPSLNEGGKYLIFRRGSLCNIGLGVVNSSWFR